MNPKPARRGAFVVLALLSLLVAGCNKKLSLAPVVNEPPTIRLSAAPVDTLGADGQRASYIYHYRMNWVGYDPDGRVSYFLYTVDPPGSPGGGEKGRDPAQWVDTTLTRVVIHDTTYCRTTLNEKEIFFRAGKPDEPVDRRDPLASDIHTFVIKAVDNSGASSAPEFRSFFSNTQAPTVRIDQPTPSALFYGQVSPFITISWHGDDPDGVFTQKCVKYKWKMFKMGSTDDEFDFATMQRDPDALRHFYAPTFAGWDSTSADTTFHTFTNLVPDAYYMFVVVGFDEAGAYSPIFSRNFNMLQMLVTFAGKNGPRICIFNEFFSYCYPSGGYNLDPSRYINIEVPAYRPVTFNWDASEDDGTRIKRFRWAMDIVNLDDNTPRSDERTDTKHWSQAGAENKSATVGPFLSDTTHFFFVESEDVNNLKSLGIVNFRVVVPTFNHELLIVNDTQRLPDQKPYPINLAHPDSVLPQGSWPSHSELDTFLFARGGVRWRMMPDFTITPPGVFAGYKYDTLYTFGGATPGIVSLDALGGYKHVVWLVDPNSATGYGAVNQLGVLAGMSKPGRLNTLAAYVILGGRVWLAGGSALDATMLPWNNLANDLEPPFGVRKYSSRLQGGKVEMLPGRMAYDLIRWQSEVWIMGIDNGVPHKSVRAVGGWPGHLDPVGNFVRPPDYSQLPSRMGAKSPADDPVPPFRSPAGFFGDVSVLNLEALVDNNVILEDSDPDPDSTKVVSVMDTLMIISGGPLTGQYGKSENEDLSLNGKYYHSNPIMTYYHGYLGAPFVMSGFDLWSYTRKDIVKLVDFVLQQVWGLPKEPVVGMPAGATTAARARERR